MLPGGLSREPGYPQKTHLAAAEKSAIADLAASMVAEGDAIVVGAGTTTQELARRLARVPGLTVVTNSLLVAQVLAHANRVEVVMTGGTLRGSNYALVGSGAEQSLQGLRVSRAFVSGSGLTAERGLSTTNMLSASVDRALVAAAAEVVVLADHSKLGSDTMFQTVATAGIAYLVTDETATASEPAVRELDALADQGVQVCVAPAAQSGALPLVMMPTTPGVPVGGPPVGAGPVGGAGLRGPFPAQRRSPAPAAALRGRAGTA